MIIKNARSKNGIIDIFIKDGVISFLGKVDSDGDIDAGGRVVIPGLVDVHIHGYGGYDVMKGELNGMGRALARMGTTCFLPTTMTDSIENLESVCSRSLDTDGAIAAGYHLEGPYISKKRKGAQNEAFIKSPDATELSRLKNVKKITVAPELDGMLDLIRVVNYMVSIGHTDCTYQQAKEAILAGASCLTHTFNAMPPLLHRETGPIGAAVEKEIYAELICDGVHVSVPAIKTIYKLFGSDRLMLVSDALSCAGTPDGEYSSGGLPVYVKGGVATLADGSLAGGSHSLLYSVDVAQKAGIDFWEAVKMASETPARSLGLVKGRLKAGYDADIVILNDDMSVFMTIVGGRIVYKQE